MALETDRVENKVRAKIVAAPNLLSTNSFPIRSGFQNLAVDSTDLPDIASPHTIGPSCSDIHIDFHRAGDNRNPVLRASRENSPLDRDTKGRAIGIHGDSGNSGPNNSRSIGH